MCYSNKNKSVLRQNLTLNIGCFIFLIKKPFKKLKGLNFKYVDSDYNPNCFANRSGKTPSAIIDAIINTATIL